MTDDFDPSLIEMVGYHLHRLNQLREAKFGVWVYRCYDGDGSCPPEHHELNGLVLPPDHPFWDRYFPPNSLNCSCAVAGARKSSGAVRVGGNLAVKIPDWASEGRGLASSFDGYHLRR